MKELSSFEIGLMQRGWTTPEGIKSYSWHEGSELLGYWPDGDSYVFKVQSGHMLAISRGFIQEALSDAASR